MPDMEAELVFAFVYGVGTNADGVVSLLSDYLRQFGYSSHLFRISEHLKTLNLDLTVSPFSRHDEMMALMSAGNRARERATSNEILAVMAVNEIAGQRTNEQPLNRTAQFIRSLKTPEEVRLLREVYRPGFFLIGVANDDDAQHTYLTDVQGLSDAEADTVIRRDQDEQLDYGQRTRDTFYLADVFVELTGERYVKQLEKFVDLVFGHPFRTPTRAEHAMFMAYASAARSAQLGRQVGAAITTPDGDVVAVGVNEVPAPVGGPYWDEDEKDARDHVYQDKIDSNYLHRSRIVNSVVANIRDKLFTEANVREMLEELNPEAIQAEVDEQLITIRNKLTNDTTVSEAVHSSELKDITEYGRAVHAEMDALLTCSRLGISVKGKQLFTTTFPCHNCTRHIIASGVSRVTYIEPYPKSRAADLHHDSICFDDDEAQETGRIPFVPFVGVGPRRYLDLFSADLSTGVKIERKGKDGTATIQARSKREPRVPMRPYSYLERETKLLHDYENVINMLQGNAHEQNSGKSPAEEQDRTEPPQDGTARQ